MSRDKIYRTRVPKTLNFEMNVYEEFQELCKKEDKSVSMKLQLLMMQELQKNEIGQPTPTNIHYSKPEQKPSQSDIRSWLPRDQAIQMARKLTDVDAEAWNHLAQTFSIIATKKRTGYLNR